MNAVTDSFRRSRAVTNSPRPNFALDIFRVSRRIIPDWRRVAVLILMLLAFFVPMTGWAQELKPEEIYRKILPSVLTLRVENARGETYVGTGFLALDKNVAVTAWHVVSDAVKVSAKFSDGGVMEVTRLIDKDEAHDLALIQLDAPGRPAVALDFDRPTVGSRAYVIGAPKGFEFSITDGLISQIQNIHGWDEYEVSCPISGGNSGGPIVNQRGEVVGITAWTQKDAQNLSFATPVSFLRRLNPQRAAVAWHSLSRGEVAVPPQAGNLAKIRDSQHGVTELRSALNSAAGKHVTITVSDGDSEKKFDVVMPKDFAR